MIIILVITTSAFANNFNSFPVKCQVTVLADELSQYRQDWMTDNGIAWIDVDEHIITVGIEYYSFNRDGEITEQILRLDNVSPEHFKQTKARGQIDESENNQRKRELLAKFNQKLQLLIELGICEY